MLTLPDVPTGRSQTGFLLTRSVSIIKPSHVACKPTGSSVVRTSLVDFLARQHFEVRDTDQDDSHGARGTELVVVRCFDLGNQTDRDGPTCYLANAAATLLTRRKE